MPRRGLALGGALLALAAAAPPPDATLDLTITGLRSARGTVLLCLTQASGKAFLQCDKDPHHIVRRVAASSAGSLAIGGLAPGRYSLLLVHDENGNGKLDTMMGIPREGFGFSRNPAIRMGPPAYDSVRFDLAAGRSAQVVKVRYLL